MEQEFDSSREAKSQMKPHEPNPYWNPQVVVKADHRGAYLRGLAPRYIRQELEAVIGQAIPDDVWDWEPWGHRVLLIRDLSPDMVGSIVIPANARDTLAAGFVVKVGPDVGLTTSKFNGDAPFVNPGDMVGSHVIFGRWCGKTILAPMAKNVYDSEWLVMTEDDIWGHDCPRKENT